MTVVESDMTRAECRSMFMGRLHGAVRSSQGYSNHAFLPINPASGESVTGPGIRQSPPINDKDHHHPSNPVDPIDVSILCTGFPEGDPNPGTRRLEAVTETPRRNTAG